MNPSRMNRALHAPLAGLLLAAASLSAPPARAQTLEPTVPPEYRGQINAERVGIHDANRIRTEFQNFGMVGDFEGNPDLTSFHSVEVPRGIGLNYSDGITPFVLARIVEEDGTVDHVMLTGYRERQARSPKTGRVMRFEPRPGYFEPDPTVNRGLSIAISNDPNTWPGASDGSGEILTNQDPSECWYDKRDDADDPGWCGSWNGFFGKRPNADQESFFVMDDQFYDAWDFTPDARDPSRRGLALRVEVRGFQWANPQAQDVIFWHYDIVNEGTVEYEDIIFGLYMDSGVGGSQVSCDNVAESDDDNAFYNTDFGLDLVYTWDRNGHGVSLRSRCEPTGYLGYAYLETPGNGTNLTDDDEDGITDELRDGGPGTLIEGQDAIRAAVRARYNMALFEQAYGPLEERPAFIAGAWWTGDEDLDWVAESSDTGADGVFADPDDPDDLPDTGEGDGRPTEGEPNFDRTDITESDQIGLTGFKMNRIRGPGETDNIVFFENEREDWPRRLYNQFSTPAIAFDNPLVQNYNIGFLFASGPFPLEAGRRERFSLALAYGSDLTELQTNVETVQAIYDANYQFATPPKQPKLQAYAGDGFVTLTWDNAAERSVDPVTNRADFEGYRVYRSTDPFFLDAIDIDIDDPRDTRVIGPNGEPLAQFDLKNDIQGYSDISVKGLSYYLGQNTGITHTYTDTDVVNGRTYYYAVTAYDRGEPSFGFSPSENAITISRTARSGTILPSNAVVVRPNAPVAGYVAAQVPEESVEHAEGDGTGTVAVAVVDPSRVPDNHTFRLEFAGSADSVRAESYRLVDETTGELLFVGGQDFDGLGEGPVGLGVQPIIETLARVEVDTAATGFTEGSDTDAGFEVSYVNAVPRGQRRPGYPEDLIITFADTPVDTSRSGGFGFPATPAHFTIVTAETGTQLDFTFIDRNGNRTLDAPDEVVEVYLPESNASAVERPVWQIGYAEDTDDGNTTRAERPPGQGDTYRLALNAPFSTADAFTFTTRGAYIDEALAREAFQDDKPYAVPNPYRAGSAFEQERFASNEFVREIQFRRIPAGATIRIYTVRGHLVQTLQHDGLTEGSVPWNLRSKDNLEIAPGLYIFHVDAGETGEHVGKFAIIK